MTSYLDLEDIMEEEEEPYGDPGNDLKIFKK